MTILRFCLILLAALLFLPIGASAGLAFLRDSVHWSTARTDSAGFAPRPEDDPQAIIQAYGARLWGWRGAFAVHTWIALKPAGAKSYTRYDIVSWARPNLRERGGMPDGYWAGNKPDLLLDIRGEKAEKLIPEIQKAVRDYPYHDHYVVWPGPNSNTFVAHIARKVPELGLALPPTAIGKDYLIEDNLLARTPSGSGWQLSLAGLAGVSVGVEEGFEINLLGTTLGLDFARPALKLPGLGRIGLPASRD